MLAVGFSFRNKTYRRTAGRADKQNYDCYTALQHAMHASRGKSRIKTRKSQLRQHRSETVIFVIRRSQCFLYTRQQFYSRLIIDVYYKIQCHIILGEGSFVKKYVTRPIISISITLIWFGHVITTNTQRHLVYYYSSNWCLKSPEWFSVLSWSLPAARPVLNLLRFWGFSPSEVTVLRD